MRIRLVCILLFFLSAAGALLHVERADAWEMRFSDGAAQSKQQLSDQYLGRGPGGLREQRSPWWRAMPSTTSSPAGNSLVDALIERHGVLGPGFVRVLVDSDNIGSSAVLALQAAGIPVLDDDNDPDPMNNRFIVVDDARVLVSTGDFTDSAMASDDNLSLLLEDAAVATAYANEFDEMWFGTFKEASAPSLVTDYLAEGTALRLLFGADDDPITDSLVGLRSYVQNAVESVHFLAFDLEGEIDDGVPDLADDLKNRFDLGVAVRGVLDRAEHELREPYVQGGAAAPQMDEAGMDLRLHNHAARQHAKLAVIDQDILILGSADFGARRRHRQRRQPAVLGKTRPRRDEPCATSIISMTRRATKASRLPPTRPPPARYSVSARWTHRVAAP